MGSFEETEQKHDKDLIMFEGKNAYIRKTPLLASDLEDEIPQLPESFVNKFSELAEYNRQMGEFWNSLKTSLVQREERITELENKVQTLEGLHP